MCTVYKNEPKVDHYGCMLVLLGEAEIVTQEIRAEGGSVSWKAVLSACHARSNSELGEFVGKWLIKKEPEDVGPYLLLSNVYAEEGRWEDVDDVRRLMQEKGLHKNAPTYSVKDGSLHRNSMITSMFIRMGSRLKMSRI
ncbi:hypothetical protein RND81_13G019400 [Saponaria officinalis]